MDNYHVLRRGQFVMWGETPTGVQHGLKSERNTGIGGFKQNSAALNFWEVMMFLALFNRNDQRPRIRF